MVIYQCCTCTSPTFNMKTATLIALGSLLLCSATAFHFPSRRFGSMFDQPHFHQPSLFNQFPAHRRPVQPTPEQQQLALQRQTKHRLEQVMHSLRQLEQQQTSQEAYKQRLETGLKELEAQYSEHQAYYQSALNQLHPRSQRYAHVYRQAQAKLNQIQSQYRRYKQEVANTQSKLDRIGQQLQHLEADKEHLEHQLLTAQDLQGRTQETDANHDQQSQQDSYSERQQPASESSQFEQHQPTPQRPQRPLPPQNPQQLKDHTPPVASATPHIFKKTIRKGSSAQSPQVDIRSGIEVDEDGLPWQAGGIWTGQPDHQATKNQAPLSDHDEHVMYMKELREYLYR
eukprot:m.117721 g.117721  ORF g.117721 m.117721 type:complete len:342 (+) comp15551_c0_seq6:80-1105(+)